MTMEVMDLIYGLQQQTVLMEFHILMILKQLLVGLLAHHGILITAVLVIFGIIIQTILVIHMLDQILGLKLKVH
tara:strand:+ start:204 stop:425 length:222 start_codon:yes stop_codon:yes gene_type:complete